MSNEFILDEENKEPINDAAFLSAQQKKYLKVLGILFCINVVLYISFQTYASYTKLLQFETIKAAITIFGIGIPIISSSLGLLLSLIPYKGFCYSDRYLRTCLITACTLQGLFTAMLTIAFLASIIKAA